MDKEHNTYQKPLVFSVLLHVLLLSVLFLEIYNSAPMPVIQQGHEREQPIVNAVTIDQAQVQQQIQQIKAEKAAEQAKQQQARESLVKAKQDRLKELARLQKLKQEAKLAEQKRKADARRSAKRLAQLQRKQKAEQQRLATLKKQRQAEQQAAEQALAKQKAQAQARRIAAEKAARSAKVAGEINRYKALIRNAIYQKWIAQDLLDTKLACLLQVRLAPDGSVLDVKLVKSSGNNTLDRSAIAAVYKASPLPVPKETAAFEQLRTLLLTMQPNSVSSAV